MLTVVQLHVFSYIICIISCSAMTSITTMVVTDKLLLLLLLVTDTHLHKHKTHPHMDIHDYHRVLGDKTSCELVMIASCVVHL